jgi:K+-transporting ATPase ATPase C chain
MLKDFKSSLLLFLFLTGLTGCIYPLAMTGIGQTVFPHQVNGSLVRIHGQIVGSALIGQYFHGRRYFWGRPSATPYFPDNAAASGASNLGPDNPELVKHVEDRIRRLRRADPGIQESIPIDLVTSSGSGLDPDISLAAALYQLPRVARTGGISPIVVRGLIRSHMVEPFGGITGEQVVDVVRLNLALYRIYSSEPPNGGGLPLGGLR